jgi:hypothetical protein
MKEFTIIDSVTGEPQSATYKGEQIDVTDGYHTMHELYEHRMALNIALFDYMYQAYKRVEFNVGGKELKVMKSKLHHDGTMFDGYFIVMAITLHGQISYHYHLKHWDKFEIPEVEGTPPYDGHTSNDVIERLMKL